MGHHLACISLLSLFVTGLEASASQGKVLYVKRCLSCHISAKGMSSSKSAKTWKELLVMNGSPLNELARIHLHADEAETSWGYFKGSVYKEESRHLKDFLQKYSSDRGRHNSCN